MNTHRESGVKFMSQFRCQISDSPKTTSCMYVCVCVCDMCVFVYGGAGACVYKYYIPNANYLGRKLNQREYSNIYLLTI